MTLNSENITVVNVFDVFSLKVVICKNVIIVQENKHFTNNLVCAELNSVALQKVVLTLRHHASVTY